MKLNITLFLLGILFITGAQLKAQTTFSYSYDNAGNRTKRVEIVLKSGAIDPTANNGGEESSETTNELLKPDATDRLGDITLSIYPNPTKGLITVKADNMNEGTKCQIIIFDSSGKLLVDKPWEQGNALIDLSEYPQGFYLVKFIAADKTTQWKVIKE